MGERLFLWEISNKIHVTTVVGYVEERNPTIPVFENRSICTVFKGESMMQGVVNLRREATLTVVVGNSNRQLQAIDLCCD